MVCWAKFGEVIACDCLVIAAVWSDVLLPNDFAWLRVRIEMAPMNSAIPINERTIVGDEYEMPEALPFSSQLAGFPFPMRSYAAAIEIKERIGIPHAKP